MRSFVVTACILICGSIAEAAAVGLLRLTDQLANFKRSDCGPPATVTVTQTIHDTTVTTALADSSQFSVAVSSALSIESVAASVSQELTPINPTATTTSLTTTTSTVAVVNATSINPTATITSLTTTTSTISFVNATKTTTASTYYYIYINGTTSWLDGIVPPTTINLVTGTTTVVISPTPSATNSSIAISPQNVTQPALPSSRPKWSSTFSWSNTTVLSASSGSGYSQPSAIIPPIISPAITSLGSIGTTFPSYHQYGHGPVIHPSPLNAGDNFKRQVGAMVTVTTDGHTWTFPNAWDGSTTVDPSTYSSSTPPSTLSSLSEQSTVTSALPAATTSSTESIIYPSSTSSTTAAVTSCGISGAWVLGFDDLPKFSPPANDTTDFPPIFNPHDSLFFSDGWAYVPPPNEPFPPQAGPQLAEFIKTDSTNSSLSSSPDAGLVPEGAFGAGLHAALDTFWFNVDSAWVGCNNSQASVSCDFKVVGYRYDNLTDTENREDSLGFSIPGCQDFEGCRLSKLEFGDWFEALSSIGFSATVNGTAVNWFMDSVAMSWWNNTCAAGLYRAMNSH